MKDWIPLLQELVWPALLVVVLFLGRDRVGRLLKALEDRVVAGAEVEAAGIRVGTAPKLTEVATSSASDSKATAAREEVGVPKPGRVYLVHTAVRDPSLDRGELRYFRIRLYVDADEPRILDDITEVTYYLHETFNEPLRTVRDSRRGSSFGPPYGESSTWRPCCALRTAIPRCSSAI